MTIKDGDIGRPIYVASTFDMSGNTALSLKFTSPDGSVVITKSNPDVTAPASPSPSLPSSTGFAGGILPASTYWLYTTDGTEFIAGGSPGGAGNWTVCGTYTDGTPKFYQGDSGVLVISEAC